MVTDSIEIQVRSSAKEAVTSLDLLIDTLGKVQDALRIDTSGLKNIGKSIDASGFNKIAKEISAKTEKISRSFDVFNEKYKDLGKGFQLKGDEKYLQKQIDNLSNSLAKAKLRKEELVASGKVDGRAYEDAVKNVIMLENQIESLKSQVASTENVIPEFDFSKLETAGRTLDSFKEQLSYFKNIIEQGGEETESGLVFPVRGLEMSLETLQNMYPQAKELISSYVEELERARGLSSAIPAQGYKDVDLSAFEHIKEKAKEATDGMTELGKKLDQVIAPEIRETNLDQLNAKLEKAKIRLNELQTELFNGLAMGRLTESIDDSGFVRLNEKIVYTERLIEALKDKISEIGGLSGSTGIGKVNTELEGLSSAGKKATSSLDGVASVLKRAAKSVIGLVPKTLNLGKSLLGLGKSGSKMGSSFSLGFGKFLKYGIGLESLFALANKIRGAAQEGFGNLAQYSNEANTSLSMLRSSLEATKNAFAVAFAPIVNVAAPYLSKLIDMVITAANAVGRLFAALTGKKYTVQAKKNITDYAAGMSGAAGSSKNIADSTGEAAKNIEKMKAGLRAFDELNTIEMPDQSSSGGSGTGSGGGSGSGSGGTGIEDMFETVEIGKDILDFAEKIKEAWKKADFTEIGEIIGNKLKEGLDKIPWDRIKANCEKIAKSIGTFINGFVSTQGLAESIGNTIGNAINTGVSTVNTFLKVTNFHAIGEFIATSANNAIRTTDFGRIGETVANGIKAAVGTWYSFVTTFDFEGLGSKIGASLKSFFTNMGKKNKNGMTGWQELGASLSGTVDGLIVSLKEALSELPWEDLGQAIADFITGIDWGQIVLDFSGLAYEIYEGIITALMVFPFEFISGKLAKLVTGEEVDWNEALASGKKTKADMESFLEKYQGLTETDYYNYISGVDLSSVKSPVFGAKANRKRNEAILKLKADIETNTVQAQGNVNATISAVNNGGNTKDVNVPVSANTERDARNIRAGVAGALSTLSPVGIGVKGSTKESDVMEPYSDYFSNNNLRTGVKTTNTGEDVYNVTQLGFGKNVLKTAATTTNTGDAIRQVLQNTFGRAGLKTQGELTNTGSDLRSRLQTTFGAVGLHTGSYLTNTGYDLAYGLQSTFGRNTLRIGATVSTSGNELYNQIASRLNSSVAARGAIGVAVNAVVTNVSGNVSRRALGGVFENGAWKDIPQYGSGGKPDHGTLFWAGESGAEVVGHMNGRTEVLNRSQLASTMFSAVAAGMKAAMPNKIAFTMQGFKEEVESLYKTILKSVGEFGQDLQYAPNPDIYQNPYGNIFQNATATMEKVQKESSGSGYSYDRQYKMEEIFYRATYNAVSSAINNSRILGKILDEVEEGHVIEMDGKKVAETTRKEADSYFRRTGMPYFPF